MHALQSCDKMCKGNGYSSGTCFPNVSQHDTCINMNSLRIVLSCVNGSSFCINFKNAVSTSFDSTIIGYKILK
jgi:hypothetical protein